MRHTVHLTVYNVITVSDKYTYIILTLSIIMVCVLVQVYVFTIFSLAIYNSPRKVDAQSRVGLSSLLLKNKYLSFSSLDQCRNDAGQNVCRLFSKGWRICSRAGQSKMKWGSFSMLPFEHSLQNRSFLFTFVHRPVSISNLRDPRRNLVVRDLFFLVFRNERWGDILEDWPTFLYK